MKKFLKCCLAVVVTMCLSISLTACKGKVSKTTVSLEKVKVINGVSTNGGMTAVYDGYLYYINGTKTNDGKSLTKNTEGAICRVVYDSATGKITGEPEVVVGDLAGTSVGSINFFGDYMYYTAPSTSKNSNGDVLYNKTAFKRYDLVNKKSSVVYTTKLNDEKEELTYAYYVYGEDLYLMVYEKNNSSLTSIKIDSKSKVVYTISDVKSCVMSDNYGTVAAGNTVDANSFVYYTKAHGSYDAVQSGAICYRVSPNLNNSTVISDAGKDVELKSVRCGKLIYSCDNFVYCQSIKATANEALDFGYSNRISYQDYDNSMFLENYAIDNSGTDSKLVKSEGNICVVYCNTVKSDSSSSSSGSSTSTGNNEIVILDWSSGIKLQNEIVTQLGSTTSFAILGIAELEEKITNKVDDPENPGEKIDEEITEKGKYLIYSNSQIVYKLKLGVYEGESENLVITKHSEPIKLSTTKIDAASGIVVPEVVGNYMFAMSTVDKVVKMYQIDLTITENSTKEAVKF